MSKVQMLRALVKQRLTAAAEDIFGLFERTIAEYEETLCRSKEENERQRRLLDAVFNPQLRLHRADVQQLLVIKEEVPTEQQQEWSPSLDQEEPEPPHIKEEQEEQEELWTNQEGEQLYRQEEADITKFTFAPVPVKSEDDDEEKPQPSQLHQRQTERMETEADGEDCGGPEPDRNSHPGKHLTPDAEDKTEDSSETEVSDGDCEETREPQSGLNPLKNNEGPVSDGCQTSKKLFSCCECGKIYSQKGSLKVHMRIHKGEKPFSCSVCSKRFIQKVHLTEHMAVHTGEKLFGCNICGKRFTWRCQLKRHTCSGESSQLHELWTSMDQEDPETPHIKKTQDKLWTGKEEEQLQGLEEADIVKFTFSPVPIKSEEDDEEKPQSSQLHQRQTDQMETEADGEDCAGPEPDGNSHPDPHLTPDTEDKTEDSSDTEVSDDDWEETREPQSGLNSLKNTEASVSDVGCNTSKKPLGCSNCGRTFCRKDNLMRHMKTHTREKPFSCSVCGKRFGKKTTMEQHFKCHTGEKPFSCSLCDKYFLLSSHLKSHMRTHTGEKPFSCSICSKRFGRKATLQHHLKWHAGEKPYSCSLCDKHFSLSSHLQSHMRTHTGEKPYSCSHCTKCFSRRDILKSHMITHTGEKPYSCSHCDKCFSRYDSLKLHMSTHTGEKPLSCKVCNKRFTWRCQIKKHKCRGESSQLHDVCTGPEQEQLQGLQEADTEYTHRGEAI